MVAIEARAVCSAKSRGFETVTGAVAGERPKITFGDAKREGGRDGA